MTEDVSNRAQAVALRALAWTLEDSDRAHRLLALTGLSAEAVRDRIGDPALLDAVIAFLEAHEPDLIACATAIDVTPHELVAIRPYLSPSPSGEGLGWGVSSEENADDFTRSQAPPPSPPLKGRGS